MRSLRTFSLVLSFLLFLDLSAHAAIPTTGKGMWIWKIWSDQGGNLDTMISRLKTAGVTWVAVKLGDSNSPWDSPSNIHLYPWAQQYGGFAGVITKFHDNGIKVYGWQYVRATNYWSGTGTLASEADVTNQILDIPGIDGFIIDAEVEFQASGMTTVAAQYMDSIRVAHPNSFVALTSFARVTGHPLPWTTFLASCDANMPQAYWALRPTTVSAEFSAMRSDFNSWEQTWINQGYISSIKPIVPIGCENSQGETSYQMQYGDIQQFCSLCQSVGYVGVSLWDYVGMTSMNWSDYAASWVNTPPPVPQATVSMPSSSQSVPAYDSIKVSFNTPMDAASVFGAFKVSPQVNGKLTMNPDFTQWTFSPDTLLNWSTKYTITIDTSAVTLLGVHFSTPFSFEFTTVPIDTLPPALLTVSPDSGGTSVAHAYFEFIINKPVNYNSVVSHLSFVDSTGKKITLARDMFQVTSNNLTLAAFRSALALTPGMKYTASISPGVTDYYGNQSKTTYSTTFKIDTAEASGGSVVEGFESPSNLWTVAPVGQGTTGVDTASTSFSFETTKKYDGNYAGGLQYAFDTTNANAVCEVENAQGFDVSPSSSVGMWVFGDHSGNQLDYVFGSAAQKVVPVDTIDWYGWKFVGMWRAESDTSTSTLRGFAVKRLSSALLTGGAIYVDDIQVGGKVTGILAGTSQPNSFELSQNYPNPFNPTTVISYRLSSANKVTLKVYDILGREVATLADGVESAGQHSIVFNAGRLSSGVYFYSLTTSEGVRIAKKMILMK